jgi:hypothetical protein
LTPDFSDPAYNYFTYYNDTLGNEQKMDKFATSPYGGTPTSKSQRLGINVNNLFQAKVDDGEEERKVDLFTLNFGTSHDFNRDSLRWSDLSTNFRATPLKGVNMNMNASHSFYEIVNGRAVDNFLLTEGRLPQLLRFTSSLSFSLNSNMFIKKEENEKEKTGEEMTDEELYEEGVMNTSMIQQEKERDRYAAKNLEMNWNTSYGLEYRYNRSNDSKSIDLRATAGLTLTKNWRVNWTGRFDLAGFDITYQSFSIHRDLHCWEMLFSWQPIYGYYQFQINVKTSELKDLKLEKKPTGRTYY